MIVDTNALSAAADEGSAVFKIFDHAEQVALPVVVLGEYRYGIAQSRHRTTYNRWLDGLIEDCKVLDIDEGTTHHYAAINVELRRVGKPIPTNDMWIAALSRQHALPILSRDKHFDLIAGIRRLNW
ncbi:MAG: type II toxin-antitoxin system VapC family toxin [Candidatus Acidiferrum sp.]